MRKIYKFNVTTLVQSSMVHGSEVCGLTVILIRMECTEVQSELYVALDEEYIAPSEFEDVYEQARCCCPRLYQLPEEIRRAKDLNNREPNNLCSYLREAKRKWMSKQRKHPFSRLPETHSNSAAIRALRVSRIAVQSSVWS